MEGLDLRYLPWRKRYGFSWASGLRGGEGPTEGPEAHPLGRSSVRSFVLLVVRMLPVAMPGAPIVASLLPGRSFFFRTLGLPSV